MHSDSQMPSNTRSISALVSETESGSSGFRASR